MYDATYIVRWIFQTVIAVKCEITEQEKSAGKLSLCQSL
jgi:hypothetical protein